MNRMATTPKQAYEAILSLQDEYTPEAAQKKSEELLAAFMGENYQLGRNLENKKQKQLAKVIS